VTAPADGNEPLPAPPPLPDLDELPAELPGVHPPEGEDGAAAGRCCAPPPAAGVIRPVPVVSLSGADLASGAGRPGPGRPR
jgi:hypothetical protein